MSNRRQIPIDVVIKKLGLTPLAGEGGFFAETHRAKLFIDQSNIANQGFNGPRQVSTAIYYLITQSSFSSLHRLLQDEVFHFYAGASAEMLQIYPDGSYKIIRIGSNVMDGEIPQVVVPAGIWQATKMNKGVGEWSLMGTTCAPGFEYADFELANINVLKRQHPHLVELIEEFSHHGK